jgi:hypothetical protein
MGELQSQEVRTLAKPHMTPDMIEYRGTPVRRSRTISSSRLTPTLRAGLR